MDGNATLDSMFGDLNTRMTQCIERDYTPYIGDDFNSRLGNLNLLSKSWHYDIDIDHFRNKHGRTYMSDICRKNGIYPINHLKYKGKNFEDDFVSSKRGKIAN